MDVEQMLEDARAARQGRPVLGVSRKRPESVEALADWVRQLHAAFLSGGHEPVDPGPMAPHVHADGTAHTH